MCAGKYRPALLAALVTVVMLSQPIVAAATSSEPLSTVAGAGSITGVVNFAGAASSETINMEADPFCLEGESEPVTSGEIMSDGAGHLANVFVYVSEGAPEGAHAIPSEPHRLDQTGCMYLPRISGMQVGQTLIVRNGDPTLHNVHGVPPNSPDFNFAQPIEGMESERTFERPEIMLHVKCDVHPWMGAYVGVVDHPFFAVSGPDGAFSIEGLPAGTYTLTAWHETLGTRTSQVTVGDAGSAEIQFDY